MPGLIDSGFLGWLEFPLPLRLVLHLPLALAALGGCFIAITAVGWAQRAWSGVTKLRFGTFALAIGVFLAQLQGWRLIGWGFV